MHVTSNFFRCRAQRAALSTASLTLIEVAASESNLISPISKNLAKPLVPSPRTLSCLADLHKTEKHHRVA
jgi:hypothetical protein